MHAMGLAGVECKNARAKELHERLSKLIKSHRKSWKKLKQFIAIQEQREPGAPPAFRCAGARRRCRRPSTDARAQRAGSARVLLRYVSVRFNSVFASWARVYETWDALVQFSHDCLTAREYEEFGITGINKETVCQILGTLQDLVEVRGSRCALLLFKHPPAPFPVASFPAGDCESSSERLHHGSRGEPHEYGNQAAGEGPAPVGLRSARISDLAIRYPGR